MKLLFDGTATQGSRINPYSGGADYAVFVLQSAIQHGYTGFDMVLNKNNPVNPKIQNIINNKSVNVIWINKHEDIYGIIKNGKYTRFYSAQPKLHKPTGVENIYVIHGLRSIELPWDYYRYKYTTSLPQKILYWIISNNNLIINNLKQKHLNKTYKGIIDNADKLTVVSQHTKYSVKNYFPHYDLNNIHVIHSPQSYDKDNIASSNPYGWYFLMTNGNRYEKNVYRAVKAFDNLFDKGLLPDAKIVITGGKKISWKKEIKHIARYVLLDYVSSEDLEALYRYAGAFVYPSLNEGYGYPPLKAMLYGVPVAASCATSIPEVCKDGALYFNPLDLSDIQNRIIQLYYNQEIREQLKQNGYKITDTLKQQQDNNMETLLSIIFE